MIKALLIENGLYRIADYYNARAASTTTATATRSVFIAPEPPASSHALTDLHHQRRQTPAGRIESRQLHHRLQRKLLMSQR
jgi:hypothetical protein